MRKFGTLGLVVGCLSLLVVSAVAGENDPSHRGGHHGDHGQRRAQMFKKLDANADGIITGTEANAASQKRFEKLDANHDGVVDLKEVETHHAKSRKAKAQGKRGAAKHKASHAKQERKGKHWRRGKFAKRFFQRMDADNNGKVTLAEAKAASQKHFKHMDSNSDSVVTQDEMNTWRRQHRRHGKSGEDCAGKK